MSTPAEWHKSSYSHNGNNCVEAREHASGADVRDTQNRDAGYLSFDRAEWFAALRAAAQQ
ncbi:DUF397 domain-containing protein [Nocardiopsis alba]|uniref:DUF397 domain-containing protein n=1 Tax=Nocardiopsis alba TaxID=53437 RepID=UPI0038263F13